MLATAGREDGEGRPGGALAASWGPGFCRPPAVHVLDKSSCGSRGLLLPRRLPGLQPSQPRSGAAKESGSRRTRPPRLSVCLPLGHCSEIPADLCRAAWTSCVPEAQGSGPSAALINGGEVVHGGTGWPCLPGRLTGLAPGPLQGCSSARTGACGGPGGAGFTAAARQLPRGGATNRGRGSAVLFLSCVWFSRRTWRRPASLCPCAGGLRALGVCDSVSPARAPKAGARGAAATLREAESPPASPPRSAAWSRRPSPPGDALPLLCARLRCRPAASEPAGRQPLPPHTGLVQVSRLSRPRVPGFPAGSSVRTVTHRPRPRVSLGGAAPLARAQVSGSGDPSSPPPSSAALRASAVGTGV